MANKKHDVFLYALSTCIWCKKMRALLDETGVEYKHVYLDQTEGEERKKLRAELEKYNPACSFPTVIIDGKCVIGFQENEVRELLK